MKIIKIKKNFALVELEKITRKINIQMIEQAKKGDYVLVHVGFAIQKVSPSEAQKTIDLIKEIK